MTTKENKAYPKHFLADTPEEAERIFKKYSVLLNGLSYTYSVSTGVEKGELFGEAVLGLADALKGFNEALGFSFKTYAVRVIKDRLNHYVRKNTYTTYVPAYIKRANRILRNIKHILHIDQDALDSLIEHDELRKIDVDEGVHKELHRLLDLIHREAERANIDDATLMKRAEHIPFDVELTDDLIQERYKEEKTERDLEIALFVDKLKEYMDEVELSIAEGIMDDKTYEQIANEHGKTRAWVKIKLTKLKKKLQKHLKQEAIN